MRDRPAICNNRRALRHLPRLEMARGPSGQRLSHSVAEFVRRDEESTGQLVDN